MKTVHIIHSHESVRNALIQTLKFVLPDTDFQGAAHPPSDPEAVIFAPSAPARPLKTLIRELELLQRRAERPARFNLGTAVVDLQGRVFHYDGIEAALTEKEADVLLYLWQKKIPVTRDDLLRDVWEYASDVDTHTIETHIYRLRQKIEPDPENPVVLITTKDGYQLAANAASSA